jgi:quercetin dioxygenase-like cupin family protein
MSNQPTARTPGAKRAAPGEYVFDLRTMQKIMGGPAYSTAHGPCVEGDRMIVGLMRMKAGTGAEPHSHPNEQWIYVLEGIFRANIGGKEIDVTPGSVVYIPANTVHAGKATADGDVVFFTVKDARLICTASKPPEFCAAKIPHDHRPPGPKACGR